jgi:predicted nucleotidyltransferase component of viral defense system
MKGFPETEALMVRLINLLADAFPGKAILKGGMELRLLNCPRFTNDLDYVFIPFASKKDIAGPVVDALRKDPALTIEHSMHSTCLRIIASTALARVQIELSVAQECKSQEITTADLARVYHLQGRVIRAMSLDVALAHKLAAWVERNLMRDLYDVYFMRELLGVLPDKMTLSHRLAKIKYQVARKRGPQSMTLPQFAQCLREYAQHIDLKMVHDGLADIIDKSELPGLDFKIRKAIIGIAENME